MKTKLAILAVLTFSAALAQAAPPAEITTLVADAATVFTSVKAVILSVIVFFVLIKFGKMVGRK